MGLVSSQSGRSVVLENISVVNNAGVKSKINQ